MYYDVEGDCWRYGIAEIKWSEIAKAYARCNALVVSNIVGWSQYGFRDISTGATIIETRVGPTSYMALYRAMVAYVAKKRKV